jgi:serine phosphatase RsbU (regulator of sigma subunit)
MTALRRLGELAMKEQRLEPVLHEIVDTAMAVSGGDFGTIQLVDQGDNLALAAQHGLPQLWVDFCSLVPPGVGACGTAHKLGKRVIVEDIEQSPLFVGTPGLDIHRRSGVRAVQSTPLISRSGTPLGMFSVYYRDVHHPDERELGLLDLLGRQVADVIERAKAEEALRASREKDRALAEDNERLYRQQLNIAESIQSALFHIPSEIGPVRLGHLYRSATETARIGGDFYDVFQMKDGLIAIVIGDVAGHGVEAARTAALAKDVMHAFAHLSVRPHRILEQTNELLLEKSVAGFVTVFLGVLDPQSLCLRYTSAGHPRPLLRRNSGEIETLGDGAPPLGVDDRASWKVDEVELAAGDLLLLYTDGIIEARRDREFFGEERLRALLDRKRLSVGRLPAYVLDKVLAFSRGALQDDVAVLSLLIAAEATTSE